MAAPLAPVTSVGAFPYGAPAEASARFCPWCYRDGGTTCSVQAHWPEVRTHDPLYLSGVDCAATRAMEAAGLGVGLMLQPGSGLAGRADDYRWWAADKRTSHTGAGARPGAPSSGWRLTGPWPRGCRGLPG